MNLNKIAVEIAEAESGKQEVNIAQIKEIMKCFLVILADEEPVEVLKLLKRYE